MLETRRGRIRQQRAEEMKFIVAIAQHRISLIISIILTAAYFFSLSLKFHLQNLWSLRGDAYIIYEKSLQVVHAAQYPASLALGNVNEVYPYPPPAALIFTALGSLGPEVYSAVWLSLTFLALFATFRFSLAGEPPQITRAWAATLLPVLLLVTNPIKYDLQNANDNLIILAMTMASYALLSRRPVVSGILLALTISLKLYTGVLLVWLIFFRPRAAASCIAGLVVLWLVVPVLYFGIGGALQVYRGWLEQLAIVNDPSVYLSLGSGAGAPVISLRRAAATITGSSAFSWQATLALSAMQLVWLCTLGGYAARAWLSRPTPVCSRITLADWSIMLLAPLPFSPWLEPYHAVVEIPAFILCMLIISDDDQSRRDPLIVASVCAIILISKGIPTPFEARGIKVLLESMLLTATFAWIRPRLGGLKRSGAATGAVKHAAPVAS
jgi:hypothetical protein